MGNGRKWFGSCTSCDGWYHKQCLSKKLILDDDDDEEADFVCDACFRNSDYDLALDISSSEQDD